MQLIIFDSPERSQITWARMDMMSLYGCTILLRAIPAHSLHRVSNIVVGRQEAATSFKRKASVGVTSTACERMTLAACDHTAKMAVQAPDPGRHEAAASFERKASVAEEASAARRRATAMAAQASHPGRHMAASSGTGSVGSNTVGSNTQCPISPNLCMISQPFSFTVTESCVEEKKEFPTRACFCKHLR